MMNAITQKRTLTPDILNAQAAFELPERQLLALVTVVITNLLNNNDIEIDVRNNQVAVQVCAAVQALNTILVGQTLDCDIEN